MADFIVVQLLVLFLSIHLHAKVDRVHEESYMGEKRLDSYSDRYGPLIYQDIYQGKLTFQDELFFQHFFTPYLFEKENDFSSFLKSELNAGISCSNELLSEHFDDIRYSYRLITLSYLLEGQWHLRLLSEHFGLKNGCEFDLKRWITSCAPKGQEMKNFVRRLQKFSPRYEETLPLNYKKNEWWNEYRGKKYKWYSHYRLKAECGEHCKESELSQTFRKMCTGDERLMTLICSEMDEIYGLSQNRDAYYLLGLSNVINTYNKHGEAMGCLRRFSEVMSHKEVRYHVLSQLFPALQTFLRQKYQERFLQGRVFFFGSSKEFEEKGLVDLYVKEQPMKIEKIQTEKKPLIVQTKTLKEEKAIKKEPEVKVPLKNEKIEVKEVKAPVKSAFLIASEIRAQGDLERMEVDMLKLKYDYVFGLNMINTLSERLKTFMGREALMEMMNYDKLGTKEGPVPLMFLKFMIDMQEHHGLWNIVSVLGDRFYVSNEIDSYYSPKVEFIQLINNESTGRQWQIYVLRPQ